MACTPNNPTGTILTARELADLVTGVPRDVVVLIDEAYLDFVTDPEAGDALTLLADAPNLVVSRTFSKAHALAGMRVGYLVCEPGLAAAIRSVSTPFGVNLPAQAAAAAALGEAELARTAERSATVAAERDRVVDALRAQGWEVPDAQGNFFWLGVGGAGRALPRRRHSRAPLRRRGRAGLDRDDIGQREGPGRRGRLERRALRPAGAGAAERARRLRRRRTELSD